MTRILIADDNPAVRRALLQLLEAAYSSELIEVENGRAALSRALELRPDLVILDLAMPIMDGLTAAREISSALPQVPILMYTMHCTPSLEMAAHKYGVRHLVGKGNTGELLAAVEQLLPAEAREESQAKEARLESAAIPPVAVPEPEIIDAANGRHCPGHRSRQEQGAGELRRIAGAFSSRGLRSHRKLVKGVKRNRSR